MNQEITYSSSLINYLNSDYSALEITDQKKVWELIKQNYLVCDKELKILEEFGAQVMKLPNSNIKQELQNFVDGLINNKANKRRTYELKKYCELFDINLTISSTDKIYFNPTFNLSEIKNISKKYSEVETHNTPTFLNPDPIQRLKHIPTIIPLKKGEVYDLIKIISPFLRSSNDARIEDPYLPNYLASRNILKIIEHFPEVNFNLVFLTKELFSTHNEEVKKKKKGKYYDSFVNELERLRKNGYNICYNEKFNDKRHRERYIFTDNVQIYIPGGFDFLKEDGKIADNDEGVSEKREIKIEKRNFDVKFF